MPLFGMYFDPLYLAVMAVGVVLAAVATLKVKAAFARYDRQALSAGLTGAQVAARILARNGLEQVRVEEAQGMLSDHYDPRTRTVRLSPRVYRVPSVAAAAVAAHEVGHALQHAERYAPLTLRSAAVPIAKIGTFAPWIILIGGFVLRMMELVYVGVFLFAGVVAFQLITLPVEFNASRRARAQLAGAGLVGPYEETGVRAVLSAAAMTYVAAAITALLQLLYWLMRLGLLGGRRD